MPGLARNAATWPGVAIPSRSPTPAEVAVADQPRPEPRDEAAQRGRVGVIGLADDERPAAELGRSGRPARSVRGAPVGAQASTCQPLLARPNPDRAAVDSARSIRSSAPACRSAPSASLEPASPVRSARRARLRCHAYDSWTQAWAGSKWGIIWRPSPAMTHR